MTDTRMTRRAALGGLAAAPAGALAFASPARAAPVAVQPGAGVCVLTPQAVEGPFYFDPALMRVDITEGLPGVPLELALAVIDAATCTPLAGARVDVWHADAAGRYSGYAGQTDARDVSTKGETFLRGAQMTDAAGAASFRTVYPGWYRGRTPHIHVKVFLDARTVLTTQLYFPDALSEYIFDNVAPYGGRATKRDTVNATDGVLEHTDNGRATLANLREETDRYVATLTIAADRRADASAMQRGGPPPPSGGPEGGFPPPPPGGMGPGGSAGSGAPGGSPDKPKRPNGPLVPGQRS